MAEKLNLHQKLVDVRRAVKYLRKDNQGDRFKFVSSSQALGAIRGKLDELNVLLVPRVVSHTCRDHKLKNGGIWYLTGLEMEFTWVDADNPKDTIGPLSWYAEGLDDAEKGPGKALTYAEKYFMLKFFNVATDKDDPDAYQERVERTIGAGEARLTEAQRAMVEKIETLLEAASKKQRTGNIRKVLANELGQLKKGNANGTVELIARATEALRKLGWTPPDGWSSASDAGAIQAVVDKLLNLREHEQLQQSIDRANEKHAKKQLSLDEAQGLLRECEEWLANQPPAETGNEPPIDEIPF